MMAQRPRRTKSTKQTTDQAAAEAPDTGTPAGTPAETPEGESKPKRRSRFGLGRSRKAKSEGAEGAADAPAQPESTAPESVIIETPAEAPRPRHREAEPRAEHVEPKPLPVHSASDHGAAEADIPEPASAPGVDQAALHEIFSADKTFADLGLRNSVMKGVEAAGFKRPTAIQASLIPFILQGKDVLGQAKTGTGKTAAFGLPLIHLSHRNIPFQALVLAPTRELAIQISADMQELAQFTPIKVMPIYGGQSVSTQASRLRHDPEIIVGTPGRIMDMVERRLLHFNNIRFAVLDEVDRMLDIGFREDIRRILGMCPKHPQRQTIFVSATISGDIEKLARTYMTDPEKIVAAAGSLTVSLVKQYHLPVQPWDKRRLLKHLLTHEEPALTVVFCRLKRVCDELSRYLQEKGIDAHAIHADLPQGKRNQIMERLRSGKLAVLIASDLASRGIDVEGITHVINYDLPEDVELYVHRIGRTARAGRGGIAWSFVTPEQGHLLTAIEQLINAEIPKLDYPDFEPGPVPEGVRREQEQRQRNAETKTNRFAASSQLPVSAGAPAQAPAQNNGGQAPHAAARPQMTPPALDPTKFPGGIIPTKLPPKRLQGRIKSNRR
jgi:superfamily II DNA/RNA helicase